MRRISIRTATAVKAALAAAAFGGLVAGCAPVQMGAAATVGSNRISTGQLNSEVSTLAKAAKPYAGQIQLTTAQMPKDVLGWLIRFRVREDLAAKQHIHISATETHEALAQIQEQATQEAQQEGVSKVTLDELAVANGLPPNLLTELGRYQAVELAYATKANGGKLPTDQNSVNTITKRFTKDECVVYKDEPVRVNPQFGTLNYTQQTVVAAPDTLSRAEGSKKASTSGLSPSC